MGTITPLKPRSGSVAAPPPAPDYVILSPAARDALTALRARVGDLERIFAGSATPAAQAARIELLTLAIRNEAARLARLTR